MVVISGHPISKTFQPTVQPERSLYIHVPFCEHRCGYCNFTLVAGRDHLIQRYLDAIEREIHWLHGSHNVGTVFLGGGTPSHLNHDQLLRLAEIIRSRFTLSDHCEFSVECNPNDLDEQRIKAFTKMGVTRLSIGAQSLDDDKLQKLDRRHSSGNVKSALAAGRTFANSVSLDMIFAAPGETAEDWIEDLCRAIELSPDHISTYELTYEKGTSFWARRVQGNLRRTDEDLRANMYLRTIELLNDAGLMHYEISSFARDGHRCRHNQSYWNGGQYFAFGPGASRYIDAVRETNHRSVTTYLKRIEANQSPIGEQQVLDDREVALDRLVFGLRQIDGISLREIHESTGVDVLPMLSHLAGELVDKGLITLTGDHCRLTPAGVMVADSISEKICSVFQRDLWAR